jgi:hypothetical protein
MQKKATNQNKAKQNPKPIKCYECGKGGHFAHNYKATPPTPLPKHSSHTTMCLEKLQMGRSK